MSKVLAKILGWVSADTDSFLGFSTAFPLGTDQTKNEEDGHGVRY